MLVWSEFHPAGPGPADGRNLGEFPSRRSLASGLACGSSCAMNESTSLGKRDPGAMGFGLPAVQTWRQVTRASVRWRGALNGREDGCGESCSNTWAMDFTRTMEGRAMKNLTMLTLLVALLTATPLDLKAQEVLGVNDSRLPSSIAESATRAALRMELQPPTAVVVRGRRSGLFWTGIVLLAGGAALMAMSDNVLASRMAAPSLCERLSSGDRACLGGGTEHSDINIGAFWGGVGMASVGATLAIRNRRVQQRQDTRISVTRGGAAIFRTVEF